MLSLRILYLLVFSFCIFLVYYCVSPTPPRFSTISNGSYSPFSDSALQVLTTTTSASVTRLMDQVWSETPIEMELTTLKALCSRTQFKPNVYLQCTAPYAGLTTIMSQVKVCLRMAIESGTHLVLPAMALRDRDHLTELNKENEEQHRPYGEWFDQDALVHRLTRACPALKIALLDEYKKPAIQVTQHVALDLLKAPYFDGIGNYAWPGRDWTVWYNGEMESVIAADALVHGGGGNVVVKTFAPLSFFNVMNDVSGQSLALWNEMNYLIRFKSQPRKIVATLLESLKGESGALMPFYGVHFRTEKDSPDAWTKADVQIERILQTADAAWETYEHDPTTRKIIYLACGDAERIAQFEAVANARGWQVFDKYRMARTIDAGLHQELVSMHFDHQGMIDLGIMLNSEFFIGLTNSAFSFTIAHARDPRGRYAGSALTHLHDPVSKAARTHLFDDGDGHYPCCL